MSDIPAAANTPSPAGPRVLLVHQAFVSPREGGGTRHYEFARYSGAHGAPFTIVASNISYLSGGETRAVRHLFHEETIDGIRVLRTRTLRTLHRSFTWRIASFLSFMVNSVLTGLRAGPCDLVMGTTPPIFQAFSAWALAALRRKPLLLEVRDLWPEFAIDMGVLRNPALIAFARVLERFLYRRAAHIVVNSPAYRDYLITRKNVDPARISLIANGVDPHMFAPEDDGSSMRRALALGDHFVVTYAGALGLANDIPTILRAAALLRDSPHIRILLVGDGKERPNLEAQAQREGLSNVQFTGARPKADMQAILAASDCCLATLQPIPMFAMTYPNKVFDYMAAGRPTVLAIDGVIRTVIEAAGGGLFVPPGHPAELADAIRALSRDRTRCREMGRRAREYVVRHFDRQQQAQDFLAILRRVAPP